MEAIRFAIKSEGEIEETINSFWGSVFPTLAYFECKTYYLTTKMSIYEMVHLVFFQSCEGKFITGKFLFSNLLGTVDKTVVLNPTIGWCEITYQDMLDD